MNIRDNLLVEHSRSTVSSRRSDTLFSFIPDLQQRKRVATPNGGVTHSVREAGELSITAESHYITVFLRPVAEVCTTVGSDRLEEINVPVGAVGVAPAGSNGRTIWPGPRETVAVVIPPERLAELAEQECRGGITDIRFTPAVSSDRWALQVAQIFRDELISGSSVNELYVDSLITVFGIHLLRKYGNAEPARGQGGGRLSSRNEVRIREFLSENFRQKLSVADLAGECGLSQGHFIVAFTNTFGERPHQYLIKRRLDHAQRLLRESDMPIAEIALLCGFSSQSHLTASMKKDRGITPRQVRSGG
ncbi:AraC family transcriptional regulator [Nitratireductor sp. R6]|uniref:AraC family transcriptional regulator n=1 Tax=Nitratireductor rhodophyticola TaxID=2854036 RepID=A0ABS7R8U9_9HYPH|nr:AraC family transcriptional regulator [Nitratireductor rhodophyticola]